MAEIESPYACPNLERDCSAVYVALHELVRLKDLKDAMNAIDCSGSWTNKHRQDSMRAEYERCQPLAWNKARKALYSTNDASAEQPK